MEGNLVSRRTVLKYAGLISLAAHGWPGLRCYAAPVVGGYGTDPNLLERAVPWPKTLSPAQLTTLATLCDIVLPADPPHPSARTIRVHEFLDEWLSAPYPQMQADNATVLSGLRTLDVVMLRHCQLSFTDAERPDQMAVFDHACINAQTRTFARRVIELICDGYYPTREGHAAIGYVGNVALRRFPGPPPDIVRYLEQELHALPDKRAGAGCCDTGKTV